MCPIRLQCIQNGLGNFSKALLLPLALTTILLLSKATDSTIKGIETRHYFSPYNAKANTLVKEARVLLLEIHHEYEKDSFNPIKK